jgi:hypothetical protein
MATRPTDSRDRAGSGAISSASGAEPPTPDTIRRSLVLGGSLAAGVALAGNARAQTAPVSVQTETGSSDLEGAPVPEPPADRSAGPVRAGRGSMLIGKVAVVTGAARGSGGQLPWRWLPTAPMWWRST